MSCATRAQQLFKPAQGRDGIGGSMDGQQAGPWTKYQGTKNYIVTSPDGRKFEVTAPEGATEEEVLAYAQANHQNAQPAEQGPWTKYQGRPFDKGSEPADQIEVEMPDGTILQFPGDTAPEVMQRVARQYHANSTAGLGPNGEPPIPSGFEPMDEPRKRAKPWAAVAQSAEFRALQPDQQEAARNQYFDEVVAPHVPPHDTATARAQFDRDTAGTIVKRVQYPDGSIHRVQAPAGATNEQIIAFVQGQHPAAQATYTEDQLFAKLEKADAAGDTEAAHVIADEIRRLRAARMPVQGKANDSQGKPSKLEASLRGIVNGDLPAGVFEGLKQFALGTGQLALEGGPGGIMARKVGQWLGAPSAPDPLNDAANGLGGLAALSAKRFEQSRAGQNYAGQGGRMIGETAPAMLIPGGQTTLGGRLGAAALGGAVAGAGQPVTEGDYATQKAMQTGEGAGLGMLGQFGLGEPARWGAGRLAALAAGGKANISAAAQAALDYAKRHGLPIYADDVMASPTARGAGVFVDDVPGIGGAGRRRAQSEAAAGQARALADRFPAQGPNAAQTLAESAEAQLQRARGIKNKLYADAFGKLNQAGDFALLKTRAVARQLIGAERAKGMLADSGLIAELQKYAEAPRFNFEGWHGIRSDLGNLIRSKRTGDNAVLSDRAGRTLSMLKSAMDGELSQAANRIGGGAANAWKAADKFYREAMPQYRRGTVAAMLKSPDPDAIANRILGGRDSGNIARQVYGALDKTGRAKVRSSLVSRALERSMKQTDGGEAVFSPGQFAKELDNVSERTAVFFSKTDRQELDGLRNYMSFVRNSGHYASNPQTGRRLITHLAILGGTGAAGVGAPVSYGAVTLAARGLLRTEPGRNLLLRLGSQSPASKGAEQTMQLVNSYLERVAASEQARSHNRGR